MTTLNSWRLTLVAGLWFAILYAVCLIGHFVLGLGAGTGMFRFWEIFLLGFNPNQPWTLFLGLLETFGYGAFAGWVFAMVFNAVPIGTARRSGAVPRATP